jgi:hypothetical protein
MPRNSPFSIEVTAEERAILEATARRYTLPYRELVRAKIILTPPKATPSKRSRCA